MRRSKPGSESLLQHRSDDVAFARSLLRHARNPAWLRTIDGDAGYLPRFEVLSDDLAAASAARQFIRTALVDAPERVRSIVERTALGGETCRDVAASVGVSLRQLHRDRARAANFIAHALRSADRALPVQTVASCADFEMRAAHARALVDMGHFDRAELMLTAMARSERAHERSEALHHLTACSLERGDTANAQTLARSAFESAGDDEDARLLAQIDSAAVEFARGALAQASRTLRACALQARALLEDTEKRASIDRTRTSLIEILLLQSYIVSRTGSARAARGHAREARLLFLNVHRPPAYLRFAVIDAHVAAALGSGGDLRVAAAELSSAYDMAISIGHVRTALTQVCNLATLHVLQADYQLAADRLSAALPLAAMLPSCRTRSEHAILLALAHVRTNRAAMALQLLDVAAQERPALSGALFGLYMMTRGKALIAMDRAAEALEPLDDAAANLALFLPNAVGPCLHIKAQALLALRRHGEAEVAARDCVHLIERGCHASVLAVARVTLASVRRKSAATECHRM